MDHSETKRMLKNSQKGNETCARRCLFVIELFASHDPNTYPPIIAEFQFQKNRPPLAAISVAVVFNCESTNQKLLAD